MAHKMSADHSDAIRARNNDHYADRSESQHRQLLSLTENWLLRSLHSVLKYQGTSRERRCLDIHIGSTQMQKTSQ